MSNQVHLSQEDAQKLAQAVVDTAQALNDVISNAASAGLTVLLSNNNFTVGGLVPKVLVQVEKRQKLTGISD